MERVRLLHLRPNNFFVNSAKLAAINSQRMAEPTSERRPLLITEIGGDLVLIDGHSRAVAALLAGESLISAEFVPLVAIDQFASLYEEIDDRARQAGVRNVEDLVRRIVRPSEYAERWLRFCTRLYSAP